MRALLLLSAVATVSVAATLNAQVTPAKPDSVRSRIFYKMDSAMAKRAALGLELRATGTKRDTLGVFVEAVTPKGPAETAGIIEGDRIAAINGVDLRTPAADTEDSYTNGLGSHRLSREVQKLTPGSRVTLRVYSGGRFRDVQVTAGKASDVMRLGNRFNFRIGGPDGMMEFGGPGAIMFGPDMPMMRERMEPLMKERLEPLLRERLNDLPSRIQIRSPMRFKTLAPMRGRIYKVDRGDEEAGLRAPRVISLDGGGVFLDIEDLPDWDEPMLLNPDDDLFHIETEIEPVPPDVIRELAATAIRDARAALKQLAADGIA